MMDKAVIKAIELCDKVGDLDESKQKELLKGNAFASYMVYMEELAGPELEAAVASCAEFTGEKEANELIWDVVALLLCWDGSEACEKKLSEGIQRLSETDGKYADSLRNAIVTSLKELSGKVVPAIEVGEVHLRCVYLLYREIACRNGSVEALAGFVDKGNIRAVYYYFEKMTAFSKRCAAEYYEWAKQDHHFEIGRTYLLAYFVRLFRPEFKGYEAIFGKSREAFIEELLTLTDGPIFPHKVLRGLFTQQSTHPEWIAYVKKLVKDPVALEFCRQFDLLERMFTSCDNYKSGDEFLAAFKEELDECNSLADCDRMNKFTQEKLKLPLAGIFSCFYAKGWDVQGLVDRLGDLNYCKYSADLITYSESLHDTRDPYFKNTEAATKAFWTLGKTPELLKYYYLNTSMNQQVELRDVIERMAELRENGWKVLSDVEFYGKIAREDAKSGVKGMFMVVPYNMYLNRGYTWEKIGIDFNNNIITEEEKQKLCRRFFLTDYRASKKIEAVADCDDFLTYTISRYEKENKKIYIENIKVIKNSKKQQDVDIDDLRSRVMQTFADVAETKIVTVTDENGKKQSKFDFPGFEQRRFTLLRNDENRASLAMQILKALVALIDSPEQLDDLLMVLYSNHYEDLNEYRYAMNPREKAFSFDFSPEQKNEIIECGWTVLRSRLPKTKKTEIYMNTCLKAVFYLENFAEYKTFGHTEGMLLRGQNFVYKDYMFLLNYRSSAEGKHYFTLRQRIFSRYRMSVVYSGDFDVHSYPEKSVFFGVIDRFDRDNRCIVLKDVIYLQNAKSDDWQFFFRKLHDLKQINLYNGSIADRIAKMEKDNMDLSVGTRYLEFMNASSEFVDGKCSDIRLVEEYFTSWYKVLGDQEKLFLLHSDETIHKKARDTWQKLCEANRDKEENLNRIKEKSFYKYLEA